MNEFKVVKKGQVRKKPAGLLQTQKPHHEIHVGFGNGTVLAQGTFPLLGFFGEDVTFERLLVRDLTRARYFETLFGT